MRVKACARYRYAALSIVTLSQWIVWASGWTICQLIKVQLVAGQKLPNCMRQSATFQSFFRYLAHTVEALLLEAMHALSFNDDSTDAY